MADAVEAIARPLAGKKLNKRIHKVIRKASRLKHLRRGVKEVVKSIRKGEKGILVIAGDITPLDVISHLPVFAEEASIPYLFVTSKDDLGLASGTKRPTSCLLICPDSKIKRKKDAAEVEKEEDEDYRDIYDECLKEIKEMDESIVY